MARSHLRNVDIDAVAQKHFVLKSATEYSFYKSKHQQMTCLKLDWGVSFSCFCMFRKSGLKYLKLVSAKGLKLPEKKTNRRGS